MAEDAAALSLVASAAFLEAYATAFDGADLVAHCTNHNSPAKFAGWAGDPTTVVTLAEHEPGHAPLGYTVLTAPDFPFDTAPGDIELRRIYTLSLTHGSGLAQELMARVFEDAAALGARCMLIGFWVENKRAKAFYERHGFEPFGVREFQVGRNVYEDPVYARVL